MRYMPTLRSPVSGSLVTTQGRVMKRPPSSGQHLRMGRLRRVGGVREVGGNCTEPAGKWAGGKVGEWEGTPAFVSLSHFPTFPLSSNRWITSLQAPHLTIL